MLAVNTAISNVKTTLIDDLNVAKQKNERLKADVDRNVANTGQLQANLKEKDDLLQRKNAEIVSLKADLYQSRYEVKSLKTKHKRMRDAFERACEEEEEEGEVEDF